MNNFPIIKSLLNAFHNKGVTGFIFNSIDILLTSSILILLSNIEKVRSSKKSHLDFYLNEEYQCKKLFSKNSDEVYNSVFYFFNDDKYDNNRTNKTNEIGPIHNYNIIILIILNFILYYLFN